jgi:uncharacterized protein (TIGR00369 family)
MMLYNPAIPKASRKLQRGSAGIRFVHSELNLLLTSGKFQYNHARYQNRICSRERQLAMKAKNPNYKAFVKEIFNQAAFMVDVGVQLKDVGPGWCESELVVLPKHMQQNTYVHAGVQATMADHTAGAAAGTLIAETDMVLTVEFKINLLRPAQGERLYCKAQILKPGKLLTVAESEVYSFVQEQSKLVAKASVTLAILEGRR